MPVLRPVAFEQRILIAGSKKLDASDKNVKQKMELAKAIGAGIVSIDNWILLNGGAWKHVDERESSAVDYLAADAADDKMKKSKMSSTNRILTIHPLEPTEPQLLHRIGEVIPTPRATQALRRFDLVAKADAIITIDGGKGTKDIIELAMALEKPVLPIPCTDGSSNDDWYTYEGEILKGFGIIKGNKDYRLLTTGLDKTLPLSKLVIKIILKKLRRSCFVAMPFVGNFVNIFDDAIAPALTESGFSPIRADRIKKEGNILDHMIESIRNSSAFLADISGFNPNVMYELGIADTLGKPVIIIFNPAVDNQRKTKEKGIIPIDIRLKRRIDYKRDDIKKLKSDIIPLSRSIY